MTNPTTPKPPCPFCGDWPAHDLTLRLQRHIAALQQQVEGLAAEKALLRAELARYACPPTEEAYAGREATEIGLSYAETAAALRRLATMNDAQVPADDPSSCALALVALDRHGYLKNKWAVVRRLQLEFGIMQTAAEDIVAQAARECKRGRTGAAG